MFFSIIGSVPLSPAGQLVRGLEVIWNYRGGYGEINLEIRGRKL